jgi:hypothetical protein
VSGLAGWPNDRAGEPAKSRARPVAGQRFASRVSNGAIALSVPLVRPDAPSGPAEPTFGSCHDLAAVFRWALSIRGAMSTR